MVTGSSGIGTLVPPLTARPGRSLTEDLLAEVTGLEVETVRRGLRELAEARLLAEDTSAGGTGPGTRSWPRQWLPGCCRGSA